MYICKIIFFKNGKFFLCFKGNFKMFNYIKRGSQEWQLVAISNKL